MARWLSAKDAAQVAIIGLVVPTLLLCGGGLWLLSSMVVGGSEKIVLRAPSPDGRRTAVVTQQDGGATTSVNTVVTLEPGGQPIFGGYGAIDPQGRYGVELRWQDASTLAIHYKQAHVSTLYDQKEVKLIVKADRPDDRP